jgi:hypothetical protein
MGFTIFMILYFINLTENKISIKRFKEFNVHFLPISKKIGSNQATKSLVTRVTQLEVFLSEKTKVYWLFRKKIKRSLGVFPNLSRSFLKN